MRRLIDRNPLTGQECWYEYDSVNDTATITHEQDVEDMLERNVQSQNDDDKTKRGIKGDWWKYASIPNVVWMKWKTEKGVDIFDKNQRKEMFKLLNDPEYRFLKTTAKHHE